MSQEETVQTPAEGQSVEQLPDPRTRAQVEHRRQLLSGRLNLLATELHDAGAEAESHVRAQFDLRKAQADLDAAQTGTDLLKIQEFIIQCRKALDAHIYQQFEDSANGRNAKNDVVVTEQTIDENIRQLEEALEKEKTRKAKMLKKKEQDEQQAKRKQEVRQHVVTVSGEEQVVALNQLVEYLAHLETRLDHFKAKLEELTVGLKNVTNLVKGKEKEVRKEQPVKKLMGDAIRVEVKKGEPSGPPPPTPPSSPPSSPHPSGGKKDKEEKTEKSKKKEKVKMKLPFTFSNKKDENLLLWIAEIQTYVETTPVEEESQVAFSTSCLGGEAKEWVLAEANAARFDDIGACARYGKRVLWRQKRQDHMLVVFYDDTVEKLPLEEEGVPNSSESGKGDVTAAVVNKGGPRGHFGFKKTYAEVRERFDWKGLKEDVLIYVRTCLVCQRNKPPHENPLGLLRPLPIPSEPGESISIDFMSLVKSRNGNSQVMVVVDRFSKYAMFIPLSAEAKIELVIQKFQMRWVTEYGFPLSIVSDKDVRFTSMPWQKLMEAYDTRLTMSSGRHPETNGQSEQMNRLCQQLLRIASTRCCSMAGGGSSGVAAGGGSGGSGRRRPPSGSTDKGKASASCSAPASGVTAKDPTPASDPSLSVPQDETRQQQLQRTREVWKDVIQGQEAMSKGRGEYWLKCRLCTQSWRGTSTRAVEHFMKLLKPCPLRTGEMVHNLVVAGAKVLSSDKKTQYLLKNYRQLHGIAEGGTTTTETQDANSEPVVCGYEEPQPPTTAGMAPPKTASRTEPVAAAEEGPAEGSGSNTRVASLQQTSTKRWLDNDAQKKLDIAWVEAMFRAGIAFNFLKFDTTQKLHEVYLEVASARPKVKLPLYNHMRTVMLDFIYLRIQKQVHPLTACWDESGCTFIMDGSSDRRERPVMNFLAAGEKGAVLVATVSMAARKKTAQALAKLWEQIMREIGVHRINAICTDNAEVNKKAAQLLKRRTDKDIARIPWVPCAAHCCSLLLRDISKLDWVKSTVKRGHTIVKFIRNHHSTNSLMMSMDDSLTLLCPTKVRFGSVYMMLERLLNRKAVLSDMVDRKNAARWTGIRWSTTKLKSKADLVYFTMRRDGWWTELKKVVDVMEPLYSLLRRMDRDGTSPTNLVEYDDMIERKLTHVVLTEEQRASVMDKVRDRVKMMWQPVHALVFLLDPRRRNSRWLYDRDNAIVQNAMHYLQRQVGGPWKGPDHLEVLGDLHEFHKDPTPNGPKRKDKKMWEHDAKVDCEKLTPSEWWATYGGDVPDLQAIAIKVMGMWSTATPAERNWSSMDFVHSKRRNSLKPETLEKLVYIHWNMQLLRAANNSSATGEGYVDLWSSFFEAIQEPNENDGSGRIPKKLEDEEDECTDDSDLEDELWKGKSGLSDEASGAEEEEDESDSDFELGAQPSVLGTTYVGRREPAERRREKQPSVSTHARVESSSHYHPQSDVEFDHMDTDVELLLQSGPVDEDEAEADRAKALADHDRDTVQNRIMEEDARRKAVPTRREMERRKNKVGEKEPETRRALDAVQEGDEEVQPQSGPVLKVADQQEAEHRKEADQQEAEHRKEAEEKDQQEDNDDMDQLQETEKEHGKEDEEMEHEEDEEMEHEEDKEGMESQGVEKAMEQQEDVEGMDQQDTQRNADDEDGEEEHQPAVKAVYKRAMLIFSVSFQF
ncbi:hypothetical protein CBR_g41086 [Chara braunii]|uniref:Integrase catalytic domain-containing protein n=1 Tax=Chara braunii TaxID=69332 RepID=A0A388LVF2_CHABU|nr:hypothetical protein CBR_g41086 [Chara braunii]|eukprot:GBG86182.1 hypothetical protein CBR_g41086 [Chara braunii]